MNKEDKNLDQTPDSVDKLQQVDRDDLLGSPDELIFSNWSRTKLLSCDPTACLAA